MTTAAKDPVDVAGVDLDDAAKTAGDQAESGEHRLRRTDLSRERVVSTALEILDTEGSKALSMRHLADVLGVGTMSLYHYVSDKDDLTEAVVELVLGEVRRPQAGETWSDMARAVATSFRASALAHPAAIRLLFTRPQSSPTSDRWFEVWRLLLATGMSDDEARRVFRAVSRFLVGWCLAEIVQFGDAAKDGRESRRADGDTDFAFVLDALLEALERRVG